MHVLALIAMIERGCQVADVTANGRPLTLEVANTEGSREKGLMYVKKMPQPYDGMIFAFPQPSEVYFWMKNTALPLDMLFYDANGIHISSHKNAKPFDLTPIEGGTSIQYVIELQAGQHENIVDAKGDQLLVKSCRQS